jgi:hypothetical protein
MAIKDIDSIGQLYSSLEKAVQTSSDEGLPLFGLIRDIVDAWMEQATYLSIQFMHTDQRRYIEEIGNAEAMLANANHLSVTTSYVAHKSLLRMLSWYEAGRNPMFLAAAKNIADYHHGCKGYFYVSREGLEIFVEQDIRKRMDELSQA